MRLVNEKIELKAEINPHLSLGNLQDRPYRSIIKTISWRITGTMDTFFISYLLTGSLGIAASIGGTELITKMVLYYFHERIWNRLKFGREIIPPLEYEI